MHANTVGIEQANKETVRALYAAFAAWDDGAMDALLAPDFLAHAMPPGCSNDAEGMKKSAALMHLGLHDCRNEIEDLIAEGDKVVTRFTTRATHGGELFGVPPSGRAVTLTGIEIYRLSDNKIAELGRVQHVGTFRGRGPRSDRHRRSNVTFASGGLRAQASAMSPSRGASGVRRVVGRCAAGARGTPLG